MAQKKDTKVVGGTNKKAIGVGVGLTAAAVAAAGAFFLYGSKNAAKNRKQVKSWALKAKAEILEKLEDAQEMSQKEYDDLVKSVTGAYAGVKNASKKDLMEFSKEMKDHWKSIEKAAAPLKKTSATAVKVVKKEVKAAVKDVTGTATKVAKTAKKAVK